LSGSGEINKYENKEILSHQMDEIIKNLIKQPNQLIRSDKDKTYKRNNNSFEEPEFFKVLENNKY